MMRTATRLLVALSAICIWSAASSEPLLHSATGINFPDRVADFFRIDYRNFEPENPGLGSSYGYKTSGGVTATVYVFMAGLPVVPSDVAHPVFRQLREQTIKDIEMFSRSRGEQIQHTMKETVKIQGERMEIAVLFDGFSINAPSGAKDTFAWLWPARGQVMKIRMTSGGVQKIDPEQQQAFSQAIVRLAE